MASLRLHQVLVTASLLVPAGLFAAVALHNRGEVLREGKEVITRTAAVMHEHARKVFETEELALARVDDRIRGLSWDEIASPETSAFLARLKAPLEQVVSIWVADAHGVVRAGSQSWDPSVGIAEREFFQAQRERDAGTHVSAAFRGKATRTASFAISRRRSTGDGRFDGTIHIALSPEYFARFYAEAAPEFAHGAALVRADGEVLAREPYREDNGRLRSDRPFMRQITAQPEGGVFSGISDGDGRERMYAYRKVASYPVYVAFGVGAAALLQRWHENLIAFGAVAGMASLMLGLVSWLALRGIQAERATTARLRATMDDLARETAQREAAEQRVRQSQKMEAVGQLTGGIAHDFNNLLAVVLGSVHLLRKRLPSHDEAVARLLDNAEQGAQRGAALTQRLLAFARSQALKPETVHVSALVRGMAGLMHSSLGTGVQVETHFPVGLPPAHVDANQLELALLNLAVNARDAMAGSGRLTVSAREALGGPDEADGPRQGAYVVLSVTDEGEGMDEATLARATEPFFTTKGVGKGSGLGLSMVHGFAAQSGGRVVLCSRKGEGTTAELWLPQAKAIAAAGTTIPPAIEAPSATLAPVRRRTVLLVDDDPLVLVSIAANLEDLGHAVVVAASGRQALELLRAGANVDLVITDQSMPGMTGRQLAAELRRQQRELPVLLMTGFAEGAEVAAACLPVLLKPFEPAALAAAIEECPDAPLPSGGQVAAVRAL